MKKFRKYIPHLILNLSVLILISAMWFLSSRHEDNSSSLVTTRFPKETNAVATSIEPVEIVKVNIEPPVIKSTNTKKINKKSRRIKKNSYSEFNQETPTTYQANYPTLTDSNNKAAKAKIKTSPISRRSLKTSYTYTGNEFKSDFTTNNANSAGAQPLGAFFFSNSSEIQNNKSNNGLISGVKIKNTKNPEFAGQDENTAQVWLSRIDKEPTSDTFLTLLKYYKAGNISQAVFYTVLEDQMKKSDPRRRFYALKALEQTPSKESFLLMSETVRSETNPNLGVIFMANFKSYEKLENIVYVLPIVKNRSLYDEQTFKYSLVLIDKAIRTNIPKNQAEKKLISELVSILKNQNKLALNN